MKKNSVLTVILAFAGISIACTSTGADHKGTAPVNDVYKSKQADSTALSNQNTLKEEQSNAPYTIALTGDIMMGTTYPAPALPVDSGKKLFKDVRDILKQADIAVGNLEGALCDSGETTKKKGAYSYAFRTPTGFVGRLSDAGYDFLSMANNHAFDFGIEGIRSTENALSHARISFAGIKGRTSSAIITHNGVRYGFCAFGHNSYTLRHQDLSLVKSILDSLKQKADIIIVSFHGGAEGKDKSHLPNGKETFLGEDRGSLRDFAHFCIDNGADVIYGHGPHVVRCVEVYKDKFIAYSLGNFCTPYGISTSGISGYAPVIEVRIDHDGRFINGKINSFIQQRGLGPRRDTTNVVARQIRALTLADIQSPAITISSNGEIELKQK